MFRYSDASLAHLSASSRICELTLSAFVLWMASLSCLADQGDWLAFDSSGFRIFKRFGLPQGERLTMTLYPPVHYEPGLTLQRFHEFIVDDLPRAGMVVHHYQTEKLENAEMSTIFTLRRYRDRTGTQNLVYYQGFYRPEQNLMWFVRTDLNDNIALLINHYDEELDIILQWLGLHP
jgi:hypothetical protein